MTKFKVGDRVRWLNEELHECNPEVYPPVGTVGTVDFSLGSICWVRWPSGTTSKDDYWLASVPYIELVEEEKPIAFGVGDFVKRIHMIEGDAEGCVKKIHDGQAEVEWVITTTVPVSELQPAYTSAGGIEVGDSVIAISATAHAEGPEYYPPVGTVGKCVAVASASGVRVQWPDGSTSFNDIWHVGVSKLAKVEEVK